MYIDLDNYYNPMWRISLIVIVLVIWGLEIKQKSAD